MSTPAFCVVENGCYFAVMEAGVCRGCVATRDDAATLVMILQAMADAKRDGVAYCS
jgi:hypothetical protein